MEGYQFRETQNQITGQDMVQKRTSGIVYETYWKTSLNAGSKETTQLSQTFRPGSSCRAGSHKKEASKRDGDKNGWQRSPRELNKKYPSQKLLLTKIELIAGAGQQFVNLRLKDGENNVVKVSNGHSNLIDMLVCVRKFGSARQPKDSLS